MDRLHSAIDRMDVMEFDDSQVTIIRAGLAKLQDANNPPESSRQQEFLEKIFELDNRFDQWQQKGTCSDCNGTEHRHFLSCIHMKKES